MWFARAVYNRICKGFMKNIQKGKVDRAVGTIRRYPGIISGLTYDQVESAYGGYKGKR